MKINVSVDLNLMDDDCGNSFGELVKDIIRADITRQLKKSPEYKAYIARKTLEAIKGIAD